MRKPHEVIKILTGFEKVFIKNPFKAGKDFDHLIRFSHNMRVSGNRDEFEVKARRMSDPWTRHLTRVDPVVFFQ